MSHLDERLSLLLDETVGDPPRDIQVADVRRRARRQRQRLIGGITGVALLAAVAVIVPVLVAGGAGPSEKVVGPSATIRVTPSQHLHRGQQVQVTVSGFPAGAKVWLSECATAAQANAAGCGEQPAAQPFVVTDERGAATGRFTVQSFAAVRPHDNRHTAPCGSRCVLVATVGPLPSANDRVVAYARLDFTPLPPSARPTTSSAAPTAPFTVVRRIPMQHEPQQLIAADGALFVLSYVGSNDGWTLARVDLASGQAGPIVRLVDVADMTLGGRLLWVLQARTIDGAPVLPATLVALDPATLATVHMVSLPGEPALDVAYGGGLVWVSHATGLTAVDPATATVRRTVPVANPNPGVLPVRASASADGTALWTSEPAKGGGPVPVQLRDPHTGAVVASSPGAGYPVAGAGITAADDHAWLFYGTGMMGGYTRVDRHGSRLVAAPALTGEGVSTFTNAVTAHLVGDRLWVLDGQTAAVADDRTGQPLARAGFPTNDQAALAPLPDGRLALAQNRAVLVVQPRPIDPQAYTDAIAEVNAFLASWQRDGLSVAANRYLTPAERPRNGPTPALTDGRVIGYAPYTWVSNDHFRLTVTMQLHVPGPDTGSYTNGVNSRYITFDRPRPGAAYLMAMATGP